MPAESVSQLKNCAQSLHNQIGKTKTDQTQAGIEKLTGRADINIDVGHHVLDGFNNLFENVSFLEFSFEHFCCLR